MLFASIIVFLFVVLFSVVIGYMFINMMQENKDLHLENNKLEKSLSEKTTHNMDLQKRLDSLMKKPSVLGISYRTNNKDLDQVLKNLQTIFQEIQGSSCPTMRKKFNENRKQLLDSIVDNLNKKPITCSKIKGDMEKEINNFANSMATDILVQVPTARQDRIRAAFKSMVESLLVSTCTNDSVDIKKIDQLLIDVLDAICYDS